MFVVANSRVCYYSYRYRDEDGEIRTSRIELEASDVIMIKRLLLKQRFTYSVDYINTDDSYALTFVMNKTLLYHFYLTYPKPSSRIVNEIKLTAELNDEDRDTLNYILEKYEKGRLVLRGG